MERLGLRGLYSGIPDVKQYHDIFTTTTDRRNDYIEDKASLEELGIREYNKMFHFEEPDSVASRILREHKVHESTRYLGFLHMNGSMLTTIFMSSGFFGARAH